MMADRNPGAIEYSVYVFEGGASKKRAANWQKYKTYTDMHQALQNAESLFDSKKYAKIEIKKKYFDPRNERTVDMSIKTFERRDKKGLNVPVILAGGAILSVIAFLATYYAIGNIK